jgi:hypothetical protein
VIITDKSMQNRCHHDCNKFPLLITVRENRTDKSRIASLDIHAALGTTNRRNTEKPNDEQHEPHKGLPNDKQFFFL